MSKLKALFELFRDTFDEWNEDKVPRLAAALSYYTIFSIAPLLIVVIAVAGLAFGRISPIAPSLVLTRLQSFIPILRTS